MRRFRTALNTVRLYISDDQREAGREADAGHGPGDRDLALLERLTERLARGPGELRQLVEEQDAVVRQSVGMSLDGSEVDLCRCVLEAWTTTSTLPRIAGHGRVVGAKRRLADRQRPLILFSCPFQPRQAVGMDAPKPTAGHPLGHPPGQPSKMDTLAWPAGRHERTPRRTAAAADRMAGRVPLVVCSRPSVRVGLGVRNDERLSPPYGRLRR
jgi:hypothetical protein